MIIVCNLTTGKILHYDSVSQASKRMNLKRDIILKCVRGQQKTYKDHTFKMI
jgi:hypothetical protein